MDFNDISQIHELISNEAKRIVTYSTDDRIKIMLPEIARLFNTISEFNEYDKIGIDNYNSLYNIVLLWIDYLAFHRMVIRVPIIPLYDFNNQGLNESKGRINTNARKRRYGKVIKYSGIKTIKVECEDWIVHPKYRKRIKRTKYYLVHDEYQKASIGDMVEIIECRHLSKKKFHRLSDILIPART